MKRLLSALLFLLATLVSAEAQTAAAAEELGLHYSDDAQCAQASPACTLLPPSTKAKRGTHVLWHLYRIPQQPQPASGELALGVQGISHAYQVFVNGHLVGGSGYVATSQGLSRSISVLRFPAEWLKEGGGSIAIRAASPSDYVDDHMPVRVGSPESVAASLHLDTVERLSRAWQHFLCFFAVFLGGGATLVLWAFNRESREYLWLSIYLCTISLLRLNELSNYVDIGYTRNIELFADKLFNITSQVAEVLFFFSLARRRMGPIAWGVALFAPCMGFTLALLMNPSTPPSVMHTLGPILHVLYQSGEILVTLIGVIALCACFRRKEWEMQVAGAAIVVVIVTNVLRFIGPGHLDWVHISESIPLPSFDLDMRALAYLAVTILLGLAMLRRFQRATAQAQASRQEMAAAAHVHALLLAQRPELAAGFALDCCYRPMQEVGGDFFHAVRLADGSLQLVIGDVSGKGLPAAMTVSTVLGALRNEHATAPAEVLANLNTVLCSAGGGGFTTCLCARISPAGEMTFANAGHPAPYLNGQELPSENALPLGIMAGVRYAERTLLLQNGASLTLLSDGVVEARNAHGELFGFERTRQISGRPASAIADAAHAFGQEDDITVLTLNRSAAAAA